MRSGPLYELLMEVGLSGLKCASGKRETLDKESIWDVAKGTSLIRW